MDMSPRAARSVRSSPGRDDPPLSHLTSPPSDLVLTDICRRPGEVPQRNGRPPGPLIEPHCRLLGDGANLEPGSRQSNGHGPPELHLRLAEDSPTEPHSRRMEDEPGAEPRTGEADSPPGPERTPSEDEEEVQEEHNGSVNFWREPLRFIDDSSEAS